MVRNSKQSFAQRLRSKAAASFVFDLAAAKVPPRIGNKAANLRFLARNGFATPRTFVCTWDAYQRYLQDDEAIIARLRAELVQKLDLVRPFAVRSSANIEDGLDHSFAGQFTSVLHVRGAEAILHAIWAVWGTTRTPSVDAYFAKMGIDTEILKMAVILQEMVPATISGVSFSRNPMTGMDEVLVEAVRGSGEALVQDGVTPARWTNKWGAWITRPATDDIPIDLIQTVVDQTKAIAKRFGKPVDLEWVFDGHHLNWIQMREITAADINVYSNHIAREVFPGVIKPLVWSVNVPLVNGAWIKLFTELIGPNDIQPEDLARSFHYRAYFNMGAIGRIFELLGLPRETLELLMGMDVGGPEKPSFKPSPRTYKLFPRMLRVAVAKLGFSHRVKSFLREAETAYQGFYRQRPDHLGENELLAEIDAIFAHTQEAAYFNIVTPLLMQIYNRVLKNELNRAGVDFDRLDLTADLEELQQYDPNTYLTRLKQHYLSLDQSLQARVKGSTYSTLRHLPGATALHREVEAFLHQFGHLSDSGNDFSATPWREDPDIIIQMFTDFAPPDTAPPNRVRFDALDLSPIRRLLLRPVYQRARDFRLQREAVSFLYTFGYGLFRDLFFALGERFVQRGIIQQRKDILFLYFDEIRELVKSSRSDDNPQAKIDRRKWELEQCTHLVAPSIIYGDSVLRLETPYSARLHGTPTSRGCCTGPVKVVSGIRDFPRVLPGDVLVIPYSDVGWTPLFSKAGAVVAESGGILSHSSIVAREYGIPAVVSVANACRLQDGTLVTVDGFRGEILVHESESTRCVSDLGS